MAESILRDDLEYAVHCDEKGKIIGKKERWNKFKEA